MKSIKIILFVCTLLIAVLAFASCDLLHMHEYEEWSVTKNATCTESGEKTRYCSCGEMQVQNVPAIGHTKESVPGKDASCTEGGLTDGAKCSLCGEILEAQKEIPAKKHTYEVSEIAPTCTAEGSKTYTCFCGDSYAEAVLALGHTASAAVEENKVDSTCSSTGSCDSVIYCSVCDAEISREKVVIEKKNHIEVVDIGCAADCTNNGLTDGQHCEACGEVLIAQEVIVALGHTASAAVEENKVDSTCSSTGSCDSVIYCSVCDAEISREKVVIEKKNHIEVVDIGFAADCTNNGLTDGQHCETCGEVLIAQEVIIALGHNEVIDAKVEPDCVNTGLTEGSHCSVCSTVFVEQSVLPAIEHRFEYVEGETVCPDLDNTGLAYVRCTREGCDAREEIVLPTASGQYVTEEEDLYNGIKTFKYTYTNDEYGFTVNHSIEVPIEHVGYHDYKYSLIRKDGKFVLEGICQREDCQFYSTIHIDVVVTMISDTSTCTTLGTITYVCVYQENIYSCSVPSTTLLSHFYEYIENESIFPTEEQEGLGVVKCTECNTFANVVLPIVEIGVNALVVGNETIDGIDYEVINYIYYSADYNYTFDFNVYNIACDHEHTIDIVTAPTCVAYGYTTTICEDCETVLVAEFDIVDPIPHSITAFTGAVVEDEWELAEDATEHCACVTTNIFYAICQYGCGTNFNTPEYASNEQYVHIIVEVAHVYGECHDVDPIEGICKYEQEKIQARECTKCYENGDILHHLSTGCVQTKVVGVSIGHQPGDGVVENYVAPTCEQYGTIETHYYCDDCGVEIQELMTPDMIMPLGHEYVVKEIVKPTCTEQGYTVYVCKHDETHTYKDKFVDALGHKFDNFSIVEEATCTTDAKATIDCVTCKTTFTEADDELVDLFTKYLPEVVLYAFGHKYHKVVTAPTCTEEGYTTYICAHDATHTYVDDYVNALGHKLADDHQTVFDVDSLDATSVKIPCAACDEDLEYLFVIDGEPIKGDCHNHFDTYTVTAIGVTGEIKLTIKVANESYDHDAAPALGDSSLVFVKGTGSYDSWLYLCTKCGDWRIAYIIPK